MNDYSKISILVIDDENTIVDILLRYFSTLGHDVTGVSNPVEALENIKKYAYDIVFTDLMMPEVSGMDIIKAIKDLEYDTKIIVFTGYASVESAVSALQFGVHDYIKKPFHLEEIAIILNQAIEKLLLERENKTLHEKLKQMLNNIQILYDISTLLYQIPDPDQIIEMIFDTLSESMGFSKVCCLQKQDGNDKYIVSHSRAISERVAKEFVFTLEDTIDDHILSAESIIVLENTDNEMRIGERSLSIDFDYNNILLVPITFLDTVTGFLCVFHDDGSLFDINSDITLLKILATQIAPISSTMMTHSGKATADGQFLLSSTFTTIKSEIEKAKELDLIISFAMLNISNQNTHNSDISFTGLRRTWYDIVVEELGSERSVYWDGDDTILVIAFAENQVALEHYSASIRQKVERQYQNEDETPGVRMTYSICSYPYDGISAQQIHEKLRSSLFYSGTIGSHGTENQND